MARRVYGAPAANEPVSEPVIVENNDPKTEQSVPSSPKESIKPRRKLSLMNKIFIGLGLTAFVTAASCVFYFKIYDSHYGDTDPIETSRKYIASMLARDDVSECLPREIRSSGLLSSETAWISDPVLQNVTIQDINFVSSEASDMQSDVAALEIGFANTYSVNYVIDEAKSIHTIAELSGIYSDENDFNATLEFDVIVIKSGFKWYAYTGDVSSIESVKTVPDFPENYLISGPEETDYFGVPSVAPYKEALKDLQSGQFIIDHKVYYMPSEYGIMTSLLRLDDAAIAKEDRTISSEVILNNLPVKYVSEKYSSDVLSINIANPYPEDIDVADGVVTMLFMGRSSQKSDTYPSVMLPGNVTIGTSYDDVVSVYGKLKEQNGFFNDFDMMSIGYSVTVYVIPLDAEGNSLYLGFDSDNRLAAIKWIYYDLNGHMDRFDKN